MSVPRRAVAVLTAMVGLGATACTTGTNTTPPTTRASIPATTTPDQPGDDVLTIGLLIPSTGDDAAVGTPIRDAVEQEIRTINQAGGVLNQRVRLQVEDERNDAGLSSLLDRDGDTVDAIVGPTSSLVALRRLNEMVKTNQPVVTCSPSASALSLDDFDDRGWFFRTMPSDSLLMAAMAIRAQATGAARVTVAYIDDPYGRGLEAQLATEIETRGRLTPTGPSLPIPTDNDDLSETAQQLAARDDAVLIILANESVGGRLLTALDTAMSEESNATILVNDTVRTAASAFEKLSPEIRDRVRAVVPKATFEIRDVKYPAFAAQAVDCVDLIALATVQADSDSRREIRRQMASVSVGGQSCSNFDDCKRLLLSGRLIDYQGRSGPVDLGPTGAPNRATFELIRFEKDGREKVVTRFEAP